MATNPITANRWNAATIFDRITVTKTGCWEWQGAQNAKGYGLVRRVEFGGYASTHRLFYRHYKGPLHPNMEVCHRCDNPPCCNPAHLYLGTKSQNRRDAIERTGVRFNPRRGSDVRTSKLTSEQVFAIRADARTHKEIASDYDIHRMTVGQIKRRERWAHI